MLITFILDHWRGLAQPLTLQQVLQDLGPWQPQPFMPAQDATQDSTYSWLAQQCALPQARLLPALLAGGTAGTYCYEATPCHWQAGRDDVLVCATLAPNLEEAQQLIHTANAALEDAAQLQLLSPSYWHLQCNVDLPTCSLPQALDRGVRQLLPDATAMRALQRILNTIQMAWFDHPVNQAREAQGILPINALWPHGGLVQTLTGKPTFDAVMDTGLRSQQLAQVFGLTLCTQPQGQHCLVWLDQGRGAMQHTAALPEQVTAQLHNLLRTLPRAAQIELLVTGTDGMARATRATSNNVFKRLSRLLAQPRAVATQLLP